MTLKLKKLIPTQLPILTKSSSACTEGNKKQDNNSFSNVDLKLNSSIFGRNKHGSAELCKKTSVDSFKSTKLPSRSALR